MRAEERGRWAAPLYALGVLVAVVLAGCGSRTPAPPPSDYRPTSTVKELMDNLVDPSADVIWDSVSTISTAAGVEHKMPRTEDEWKTLEHNALVLVEAGNLLVIPGRRVAQPGQKADLLAVELGPEAIEQLIAQDRESWVKGAHALHEAGLEVLEAVRHRDVQHLFDTGAALDTACESCHLKYWYPGGGAPGSKPPH